MRPWKKLPVEPPDVVALVLYGDPVAKGRPRSTRYGATYTPATTRAAEDLWRVAVISSFHPRPDLEHTFAVSVDFYTKNWVKDADNLLKLVMDSLNKVVYYDDKQVVDIRARVFRCDREPRTELVVSHSVPQQALPTRRNATRRKL